MLYTFFSILLCTVLLWEKVLTVTKFPSLIVISFDGFRYDYIDSTETPYLHALANSGVRAKWMNNVFVTKTYPNHFSIATGLYEDIHGIVSNVMYDPEFNAVFNSTTMNEERWWNNNFSNPIWIANQLSNKDRHSGCVFWSGSEVPYFNNQTPRHIMKYDSNVSWTDRVDTALEWLRLEEDPANLILFYFEEPDFTGHQYGPDSEEVKVQIRRADNITGYLIANLKRDGLFDKTNIIILSDHGMAKVHDTIDIDEFIGKYSYEAYGVTPVLNLWPNNKDEEDDIYEELKNASMTKNFSVYKREDIPEDFHYKRHRRILRIVVEANEGYQLVNKQYPKEHNKTVWGDHGYNNSLPSMRPIFIAHGPAFRKNYISEPFLNLDVFPLMCKILGIPTPPNNGSLEKIEHILLHNNIYYPAYIAIAVCILLSFLLIGGAYHTIFRYQRLSDKRTRYSHERHFSEEKEHLLLPED